MANYVDAGTQTRWAGLMQRKSVRPDALLSPPRDTSTPPDDNMLTEKQQFMYGGVVPTIAPPELPQDDQFTPTPSTLLARRRNLASLNAHIDLPSPSHPLNDEVPYSPPTTHALLSPIPEANKRHAGHTPLIPRSLSPEPNPVDALAEERSRSQHTIDDGNATPDADQSLKGALTLPTNPLDGAQDHHIGLETLDHVLGKIAKQQKILRGEFDDEPNLTPKSKPRPRMDSVELGEEDLPLSRKGSADSRRSTTTDEVDGVILKTPPSNFGAPFGQL